MSISVVYWSGTGNTQAMAEAVAEGIREAGADAAVMEVSEADAGVLSGEESFALGCPSMGAEQLEESEWNLSLRSWNLWYPKKDPSFRILRVGRRRVDERLGTTHEGSRSSARQGRRDYRQ